MDIADDEDNGDSPIFNQLSSRGNAPAQVFENIGKGHKKIIMNTQIPVIPNPNFDLNQLLPFGVDPNYVPRPIKNPPLAYAPIEKPAQLFNPPKKEEIEKMKTIIKTFLYSPQNKHLESYPKIHPSLQQISCPRCKNLAVQVKLQCKHQTCVFCLQSNVKNLIEKPSIEALKKCRCPTCLILFTSQDIEKVLAHSEAVQNFEKLKISRKCVWCKRILNACKDFFTEMDCMHLCSSCYMNELYCGSSGCMACEKNFDKKVVTLNKKGRCLHCGKDDFIVKGFYRNIHKDHLLCFECLYHSICEVSAVCIECNENFDKINVLLIKTQILKDCPKCSEKKKIINLRICPHCSLMRCFDCCAEGKCEKCGRYFY